MEKIYHSTLNVAINLTPELIWDMYQASPIDKELQEFFVKKYYERVYNEIKKYFGLEIHIIIYKNMDLRTYYQMLYAVDSYVEFIPTEKQMESINNSLIKGNVIEDVLNKNNIWLGKEYYNEYLYKDRVYNIYYKVYILNNDYYLEFPIGTTPFYLGRFNINNNPQFLYLRNDGSYFNKLSTRLLLTDASAFVTEVIEEEPVLVVEKETTDNKIILIFTFIILILLIIITIVIIKRRLNNKH